MQRNYLFICAFLLLVVFVAEPALAVAPPPPQITSSQGHTITGVAQGGATVVEIRTSESSSYCNANVQANGTFTCTLLDSAAQPLQPNETVFATAINSASERSSTTEIPNGTSTTTEEDASRGFLRDGVFGCAAGSYGMPVGTLQAIGGVYVPVNDAAVTQNTGYLVYKECVLDGVVVRMREAASAAIVKSIINSATRGGENGAPKFVTNEQALYLQRMTEKRVEFLKNYNVNSICSPFRSTVRVAIAREFINSQKPTDSFACSTTIPENTYRALVEKGELGGDMQAFFELALNPQNTAFGAYTRSLSAARIIEAREQQDLQVRIIAGNGFLPDEAILREPTETGEERVTRSILTPGTVIAETVIQALGSGFRQLESANEIDQIINSLFSGITNQIVADARGLTGLTESRLGRAPYLDQLAAEASAGVRTAAANAALTILNSSIVTEEAYNQSKRNTKSSLEQAVAQLRRAEERCWEILIPAVQQYAQTAACTTTTDGSGAPVTSCGPVAQLRIATSTAMITGGTIALAIPGNISLQANTPYSLPVVPSSVISQGTAQITVAATTQVIANATTLGIPIGQTAAPQAGGIVSIPLMATTSFSGGTLALTLASGQTLPVGEVRFALTAISPFTQAAVSLLVGVTQQFADTIIASRITPALETVAADILSSNQGLAQLSTLVQDIQNTASLTAQRIALERLDTLIAQRLIHTPYDVKDAEQQQQATEASMNALVEDTIEEWGSGTGWCNAQNQDVLRMWYDRWKVN